MNELCHSKENRLFTGIITFMMLVFVLFSAFFIALEAAHDCEGEECPVCACIEQCENLLNQLGGEIFILAITYSPYLIISIVLLICTFFIRETPISQKVRLND